MKELLITFETATLAKEKGFEIKTKHWYDQIEVLNPVRGPRGAMCYDNVGYAPTQSLLQKWLREVHKLIVNVGYVWEYDSTPYTFFIYNEGHSSPINSWVHDYTSYEQALEKGLQEALKEIKINE